MSSVSDLVVYQGKASVFVVEFLDARGVPVSGFDATANTYRAFCRRQPSDSTKLAEFACTPTSAYEVEMELTATEAAKLPTGTVAFDLEETVAGGDPMIVLDGYLEVRIAVTR